MNFGMSYQLGISFYEMIKKDAAGLRTVVVDSF
jgi:hypothetical protein